MQYIYHIARNFEGVFNLATGEFLKITNSMYSSSARIKLIPESRIEETEVTEQNNMKSSYDLVQWRIQSCGDTWALVY